MSYGFSDFGSSRLLRGNRQAAGAQRQPGQQADTAAQLRGDLGRDPPFRLRLWRRQPPVVRQELWREDTLGRPDRAAELPLYHGRIRRAADHARGEGDDEGRPAGGARFLSGADGIRLVASRSEEHTSELQSLMRKSYAVFCLKKKKQS